MAYDGVSAEGKSLQQDREGEKEQEAPYQHCCSSAPYDPCVQDGGMAQRVTDGHVAIQSHGHKNT